MSERICLALDLKDDQEVIDQYDAVHQEVWPAVLHSIKSAGIEDMQIYRTGNRLFMIMEVNKTFDAEKKERMDTENAIVQEWEERMSEMQKTLPWPKQGQKWVPMDKIFQLK